jgi:hypothetical protein
VRALHAPQLAANHNELRLRRLQQDQRIRKIAGRQHAVGVAPEQLADEGLDIGRFTTYRIGC